MGRIRYELGVSQHRHHASRFISTRWPALALAVVFIPVFFVSMMHVGMASGPVDHKQKKVWTSSSDQTLSGPWHLRVRPAHMLVPSATPSAFMAPNSNSATVLASALTGTPPLAPAGDGSQSDESNVSDSDAVSSSAPPLVSVVRSVPAAIAVVASAPSLPIISIPAPVASGLDNPTKKDIAMQLVSSAENSSLNWKAQYAYIEDIGDGRGYTGGIIGFCSGTGDMLEMIQHYTDLKPGNVLAAYIPALKQDNGSDSHSGLGDSFVSAWKAAANDPVFQQAQNDERDSVYFNPAVNQAKSDGLRALGQFIYYDAIVMHGPGNGSTSFGGIRATAMKHAKTPAEGGNETDYLNAFLDARVAAMKTESDHDDVDRVENEQRLFLKAGNFDLNLPLSWHVYGDAYNIQ